MSVLLILAVVVCVVAVIGGILIIALARRRRRAGKDTEYWKSVERVGFACTVVCTPLALALSVVAPIVTQAAVPPPLSSSDTSSAVSTPGDVALPSPERPSRVASDPPGQPKVLLSGTGFALGPPSAFPAPETDKIDLDTGERGYGPIVEQWQIDAQPDNGRRTDLIIEKTQVHAFSEGDRTFTVLSDQEAGTRGSCVNALALDSERIGRLSLREIEQGSRLCVETDEKRVALVTIGLVSSGPVLSIDYVTWDAA
ncbi:hypothetical protein [Sphaerisporangium dianthi]|uniref:Uncharacterized protein n=1 Tax=Sphaerisporangium dianthi TaxID=1436120 RepID=A0ABV9CDY6_9ACTN